MKCKKKLCELVGMDMADGIDLVETVGVAYRIKRCFSWHKTNKIVDVVVTDEEGRLKANRHGLLDLIEQKQLCDDDILTVKVARPAALFLIWGMALLGAVAFIAHAGYVEKLADIIDDQVVAVSEEMGIISTKPQKISFCKDIDDEMACYDDSEFVGNNGGEFDIEGCLDIPDKTACYDDSDVDVALEIPNVSGGCLDLPDSICFDELSAGNNNGKYEPSSEYEVGVNNGEFIAKNEKSDNRVVSFLLEMFAGLRKIVGWVDNMIPSEIAKFAVSFTNR